MAAWPDLRPVRPVLAAGRKPGYIRHCRGVITQRGKKTIGSERENRLWTAPALVGLADWDSRM